MTAIEVTLNPSEIVSAALVGVMRQATNLRDHRDDAHGAVKETGWQLHIEGALGECAVAKALGVFWCGTGRLRAADVGGVDVRTSNLPGASLILHKSDPDDRKFYLVTGGNGRYTVRGWILAGDGKRDEWWKDPVGGRPAYFVPQKALQPVGA